MYLTLQKTFRYASGTLLSVTLLAASSAFAQTATTTAESNTPVTIQIMEHLCNPNIKNIQDFQALESGKSPVAALANTVLNCPTTGLPGNAAVANTVASPRTTYDFRVMGTNGPTQTLSANGMFMNHKVSEADVNIDVNGDGTVSSTTALDISHYEIGNVTTSNGMVNVMENAPPAGFHFGALRFTPAALMNNNDANSLHSLDAGTGTIQLDATSDTDHTIMLHVYNFANATTTGTAGDMGTTTGSTTTNTGSGSLSTASVQALIAQLQQFIISIQAQIQSLQALLGTGTGIGAGNGMMTATISPSQSTVRAGTSTNFTGRNFGHEESVTVTMNGATVAHAHADGGGNFSTGSLSVPSTTGTYTYTFMGGTSGVSGTATVNVVQ